MCTSTTGPRINLLASEWCVMKQRVQVLKPLKEATRQLGAEQRVSCSKVISLLNAILFELWKYVVDEDETQVNDDEEPQVPESQGNSDPPRSEEAQQVLAGLIASIEQRWLGYEEDKIYSACTVKPRSLYNMVTCLNWPLK